MDNGYQDNPYLDASRYILDYGEQKGDRTGTGTISTFGLKMYFDLQEGFPLLTTKKVHWPSIIHELIWFINGDTNVNWLQERGCRIWNEWADENGDLGPVYGAQWRSWPSLKTEWVEHKEYDMFGRDQSFPEPVYSVEYIDQLQRSIEKLMFNPDCRRNIVSAWNVGELENMALEPCHLLFQWYVRHGEYLDCQLYQRSCDFFLGVPFNIASYAALIHIVARCTGLKPGILHWIGGDCHFYLNHLEQIETQLVRLPRQSPTLVIHDDAPRTLNGWDISHFTIDGYDPHPPIRGKVSV